MSRNPSIAVVTIGYRHFAFEDAAVALELMAIMSKAVMVEVQTYGIDKITDCTHFLAESDELPEMKFAPAHRFNPHETLAEVKARYEREQHDRQDVDQHMREAPPALPAPKDDIPF